MQCLECGREVRNINFSHLKSCSGLTPREYQAKHPGAELVDPDVKKSFGLPLEKNPKWQGGKSYRNCKYCGKPVSRHTKSARCRKCTWVEKKNSFFGKKHSIEARTRMVKSAQSRDRRTYFPIRPTSEAISRGKRHYWSKIPQSERARHLTSFIEAGQRHNKKSSGTKIEDLVAKVLSDFGIAFKRNIQIGRYNVDFLVADKIIIECFGDYWHCNPRFYTPDFYHKSLHIMADEKWFKDAMRQESLEAQGYAFRSFWEYDIKNHLDQVKEELSRLSSNY
jgi:very-short-patch-repair endonuclease